MNRKTIFPVAFILFISLAWGCAPPKLYHWGDYSNSLYSCKKDPSEETLLKHKQVLEEIVKASGEKNLRVPPGVYGELGYICLRQNSTKEAKKYFEMEEQLYPESKILMDRLILQANAREKK